MTRVTLAELFLRFKCHYGFSVSFCNPASGHEKGHVENKVGYLRRNLLVPIPMVASLEGWNEELLELAERDFQRPHYKKGLHDRGALRGRAATSGPPSLRAVQRRAVQPGAHRRIRQVLP